MNARTIRIAAVFALVLVAAFGCTKAITKIGTEIAASEGVITEEQKKAIVRSEEALRSSFEELTEEEEYYIGRSVAATILSRYGVYEDEELTRYVNRVGCAVALASDRPEIYNGYRFLLLDSDEVAAFERPPPLLERLPRVFSGTSGRPESSSIQPPAVSGGGATS